MKRKVGLFGARADNGGLGIQTYEFYKHIKPAKTLVIENSKKTNYTSFLDRYSKEDTVVVYGRPTKQDVYNFLEELDIVFCCETPYNHALFDIARKAGVKSVLQLNYEWLHKRFNPDLFLPPSRWYFDNIPSPKIHIPFPINRDTVPFKARSVASTFLHIGGHSAPAEERNGTRCLLDAIPNVKSDVKFVIYSQDTIKDIPDDPRIDYRCGDFEDYAALYDEGDVLVYPRRYGGQSLQLNEAMSSGLAIMMTDMLPQNEFLPKSILIPTGQRDYFNISQRIEKCTIDPKVLAKKIDAIAFTDISKYSYESDRIAQKMSWDTLLPIYEQLWEYVCTELPYNFHQQTPTHRGRRKRR